MDLYPISTGECRVIRFGSHEIEYRLERKETRSLSITVFPDLRVRVIAPQDKAAEEIDSRTKRRGSWIIRQQEFFSRFLPLQPQRRFVSGETHYFLGRQYRLKVLVSTNEQGVRLRGKFIEIKTASRYNPATVGDQMTDWYRRRAREIFTDSLADCLEITGKHGIESASLRIQRMKRRWGSYLPGGTIILNLDLIKAPIPCIEYVIIHELCHAKHSNHGKDFERLLTRCMPDWEKRKSRLEQVVIT